MAGKEFHATTKGKCGRPYDPECATDGVASEKRQYDEEPAYPASPEATARTDGCDESLRAHLS